MSEMLEVEARAQRSDGTEGRSALPAENAGPFVTIAVPTLNEAKYIEDCLVSLVGQWPEHACEILVLDGGSTDETAAIVTAFAESHPQVSLVPNPRRIQSAAVNLAARLAAPQSTILVRADAHAVYPDGFVRRCIMELRRSGATSVVVPMRTVAAPTHGVQRAIATAQSSRIGNGGAAHRGSPPSGFVDHGHHAAFDLTFFRRIGGYDESFTHNEDAEFDHRTALAGGRIWMAAGVPMLYYPRRSLGALARQYFKHGAGRARMLSKHGLLPRPRQMAPVAALGATATGTIAMPFAPAVAASVLIYPALCFAWALLQALRRRDAWLLAAAPAVIVMHFAWALGFLGSFRHPRLPRLGALQRGVSRNRPLETGSLH